MDSEVEGSELQLQKDKSDAGSIGSKWRAILRSRQKTAVLSAVAAALLWSTSYVVTKVGVVDVPPLTFGAIRFAFAAVLAVLLALTVQRVEPVPPRDLLRLALGGLLGITAYFSLQNLGVQRTSASDATLLVASFPAITMLLEVVVFKMRVSWVRFAGVGLAFVGVYLIIQQTAADAASRHLEGDLILLGTGLAWALYNFATQDVVRKYSTFTVIFWQTLVGAVTFLPLALVESGSWQPLSFAGLASAAFLGVFCSVAAFLLYGYGLKSLDAGSMVSLMNLVPLFGVILAVVGLQEQIYPIQFVGGLIIVAGVTLSVRVPVTSEQ